MRSTPALPPRSESADATPFPAEADLVGPSERARRSAARWALGAVGVTLLALLIYQAGPQRLFEHITALGWWAPIIFVPYAIAAAFDAAGWRSTFSGRPPSLALLYVVRLVGEAVNNVTPTAYLGGEPVKAYLLQRFGVPLTEGTASVILAKTALTVAQIIFVILGVALLLLGERPARETLPLLLALTAAGALVTAVLVRWQRRGLVAFVARGARRVFPRARIVARLHEKAPDIDDRLRAFYGGRRRAALTSVALHLIGWVAGAAEVFAIMFLIGHPVGWSQAIVIEALAQPTRLAGIFIPATLGVQEAGGMMIFSIVGLAPELGLAMMLLKRLREIGYSVLGLGLLARLRPRS